MLRRGFGDGFCSWSITAEPGPPQAAGSEQQELGFEERSSGISSPCPTCTPESGSETSRTSLSLQLLTGKASWGQPAPGESGENQGNPDPGGRGWILVVLKRTWLRDHIRVCSVLPHLAKGKGLPCRKQIAGARVLGTCSPPQTTGGPLLPSFSGAGM